MMMKKLLVLLLAVMMVLCIVACDKDNDDAAITTNNGGVVSTNGANTTTEGNTTTPAATQVQTPAPNTTGKTDVNPTDNALVGTWKGEVAIGDMMDAMYATLFGDYFDFSGITFEIVYTFTADTLTVAADEASVNTMVDELVDAMFDGMKAYADAEGEDLGMNDDELRTYCEESLDADGFVESFEASNGYYTVVGTKLYAAEDEDDLNDVVSDDENYSVIEVNGSVLTISDMVEEGESAAEYVPGLLPITLNKQ